MRLHWIRSIFYVLSGAEKVKTYYYFWDRAIYVIESKEQQTRQSCC